MKEDIKSRVEIEILIRAFYEKVKSDDVISFFFTDIMHTDWEEHLPVMFDFWENVLFYTGAYSGNPMTQHMRLHQKSPMKQQHFERWLELFLKTADELFEGENTEQIKQRATSIAGVMQFKIVGN